MDSKKRYYLVCYDIHDPKRLRRVAKRLQGYGHRMQESVFRCHLSQRQVARLRWELQKVIEPEDELLYVQLCDSCLSRVDTQGTSQHTWPTNQPLHEVI